MDPDNSAKTGQKRKRYEPPQKELGVRVQQKLYHEKKEVHRASKRARTFETQKVVKKLKDLRKKSDDKKAIENSEAELTSLKTIDHDTIGNSALRTKILKDHTLRDHADVKMALESELSGSTLVVPAEPGTPLAKIQSRLLSSKILAQQVAASVTALKVLLNPELVQGSGNTDVGVENGRVAKIAKTSKGDKKSAVQPPAADGDEDDDDDDVDDDAVDPDLNSDSDARVDFLDDEDEGGGDDGWESGSIADGVTPGHGHEVSSDDDDDSSDSDARSDQEDSDDDDGDQAERPTRPTKAKTLSSSSGANDAAKAGKGRTTSSSLGESTFLPSLSVGYIKGSDDEDFDDGDDDDKPKKNRRGQRARRAIWEKKFGRNANHKKKEAEEMAVKKKMQAAKANGRPINTGANAIQASRAGGGGPNRSRQQQQQPIDGGWKGRAEAMNAPPVNRKPAPSEKPLHPSWEAKRRLREKESAGIVPAQGKKIKF